MSNKLTLLFAPLDGHGHINACHGLAEELKDRGHRVVFAIDFAFKGRLTEYGFEEVTHTLPENGNEADDEFWPKFVTANSQVLKRTPIEIVEGFCVGAMQKMLSDNKAKDDSYKQIIEKVKPHVIIIDSYICSPALTNSGIPWVWLFSAAPLLFFNDTRVPPPWSGLPTKGNKEEWITFRQKLNEKLEKVRNDMNEWCISKGAPKLPPNALHPESPYLNIYIYPQELDYEELQPLPKNWLQVDSFVRTTDESFTIPKDLEAKPGKLVFLSMGTFGCADLDLMTRITRILGKSQNRFIVSKGPLHDKYQLPDNMWGERMLPQTKVLPLVDLVITHGGNNTVTEAFYFGKPLIVLPLFADQLDNAQRVKELGFGVSLNPYTCSETTLIGSVDAMLSDKSLKRRMSLISDRIQNSKDKKRASDLIEMIVTENK